MVYGQHYCPAVFRIEYPGQPVFHAPFQAACPLKEKSLSVLGCVEMIGLGIFAIIHIRHMALLSVRGIENKAKYREISDFVSNPLYWIIHEIF